MILVYQNGAEDAGGALLGKVFADGLQRVAFVENVVDDQNGAAARILRRARAPVQQIASLKFPFSCTTGGKGGPSRRPWGRRTGCYAG